MCRRAEPLTAGALQFMDYDRLEAETRPSARMPDLKTLQQEMQDCRQEIRNLTIMGMKPRLTREKKALLQDLERSARAELKLRHKAICYLSQQNRLR